MAVRQQKRNLAYGLDQALQDLAPKPIVAQRAPTTNDFAEIGTTWVDVPNNAVYVLASITANSANWTTSPASGVGIFASVTVNPGDVDVTAGDVNIAAGNLNLTAGNATIGGNLSVAGVTTITGDLDLTSAALIDLTSTLNAAPSILLHANGGVAESIELHSDQGTSVTSINIHSDVGGITLASAFVSADAINLEASVGGIDMDSALQTNITSSQAAVSAIRLLASAATGGIDIDTGTGGITIDSTGAFSIDGAAASNVTTTGAGIDLTLSSSLGSVLVESTEDAALAIRLHANGGVSETIQLHSDLGTGVGSINLLSDVGGLTLRATGLASADAINLEAPAGGIDADAALQINVASSQAAADALRFVASNAGGGIDIDAGTTGIAIDTTGGFSIDGAAASNVTTTGAGIDLTLSSVLGSVLVESTEDAALAIRLHANGGTSETIQLHSDQGTGVGSVNLLSDVGGLTLRATGLATADAINFEAAAGGIDWNSALQSNIDSSQAAADALRLIASNAGGGIDIDAGTTGIAIDTTGAISLDAAAASNFTATGAFDVTISSTAGSVILSGGEAVADAIQITASNAAGGLDLNAGTGGVAVDAVGGSIALTAGTGANGSVTLTSTGTGDIILNSDDTMLLDADGVLELNSSAGAISIGNDADAQAINIGGAGVRPILIGNASAGTTVTLNSPANVGITLQNSIRIITGAGSPDTVVTAPAGSLFLRTDPAGATSRAYINTDSATAWTNITCAA